jgi:hypothetical protein
MDWDPAGARLGFHGAQVLAQFEPQWHHIYPKKFLKGHVDEATIDALANIAVIGCDARPRRWLRQAPVQALSGSGAAPRAAGAAVWGADACVSDPQRR